MRLILRSLGERRGVSKDRSSKSPEHAFNRSFETIAARSLRMRENAGSAM